MINLATLLMFIVVDPYLSLLTDDAVGDRLPENCYRRSIVFYTGSRFLGTVLTQHFLIPGAKVISAVSRMNHGGDVLIIITSPALQL